MNLPHIVQELDLLQIVCAAIPVARGSCSCSCPMRRMIDASRLVVVSIAGWSGQQARDAIDCLRDGSRVLRERLGEVAVKTTISNTARRWLFRFGLAGTGFIQVSPIEA